MRAAFTLCYQLAQHSWVSLVVCGAVGIATVVSMHLTCVQHNPPSTYGVPLFPYVPALSAGLNCFLLGQLKAAAYERFAVWSAFVTGESEARGGVMTDLCAACVAPGVGETMS